MRKKRGRFTQGQITVFIILGMAMVLILGIAIVIQQRTVVEPQFKKTALQGIESSKINEFVNNCLKQVSQQGIRLIAMQGGYLNPEGNPKYTELGDGWPTKTHYFFGGVTLPYLWLDKKSQLRPINDVKKMLGNYVAAEMQNCLDFSSFEKQNYHIKKPNVQDAKADIIFSDEFVAVNLKYPLVFERAGAKTTFEDFSASISLRLSLLYKIAEKLLNNNLAQKYEVHKHCDMLSSKDKLVNVYVRTNPYDYDYVVQIIDAKPLLVRNEMPLKFQFATRNAKLEGDCVG